MTDASIFRSELDLRLHGLWLPLVTPFRDGVLDEASLRRLVRHYAALPVDGLILAATTGESLTLEPAETERLVFAVRDEAGKTQNLPILPRPVRQQHRARCWTRWTRPRHGRSTAT